MPSNNSASYTSEYLHRIASDATGEHISLGSDVLDNDGLVETAQPKVVTEHVVHANRTRGKRTELTFFQEGYLRVRERQGKTKRTEYLLDLRFLSPVPTTERTIAVGSLYAAGGLAALALVTWILTLLIPGSVFLAFALGAASIGTLGALGLATYFSYEKTTFSTAAGNAVVLTLFGGLDSFKRCRQLVPKVVKAIEAAQAKNTEDRSDYLRLEMREHYRLKEFGVLANDDCSTGTRRILSEFG